MRTGVVSVADETCAILAFGGMLAALHCARTQGIGQKVDCSLLGGQIRLMGWTLTTAMWRNRNPVTGQARITGTPERPGMSASFNDIDGKPLVFQLNGAPKWKQAMSALGFYDTLVSVGFGDLGVVTTSDERRETLLKTLDDLFATGPRDKWVELLRGADIVSAPINTLLEASNDPDVLANGYVTEVEYPKHGKKLKVHGSPWNFSETPARIGIAPELGEHNEAVLTEIGYSAADIPGFPGSQGDLTAVVGVVDMLAQAYSIFTPAVRATFPHFAMSVLMRSASCSGVPPTATPP